jgi:hypothetical protein
MADGNSRDAQWLKPGEKLKEQRSKVGFAKKPRTMKAIKKKPRERVVEGVQVKNKKKRDTRSKREKLADARAQAKAKTQAGNVKSASDDGQSKGESRTGIHNADGTKLGAKRQEAADYIKAKAARDATDAENKTEKTTFVSSNRFLTDAENRGVEFENVPLFQREEYKKYTTFQEKGMPRSAIVTKMKLDGISEPYIENFFAGKGEPNRIYGATQNVRGGLPILVADDLYCGTRWHARNRE